MILQIIQFYNSQQEFKQLHLNLKQIQCPHCKAIGFLILHGFLYGYNESSDEPKNIRGHRIFCSNRKNRNGCGKTFSILFAGLLKNHTVTARSFWNFFKKLLKHINIFRTFKITQPSFSISSAYRLFKKFSFSQSKIRTNLIQKKPPPAIKNTIAPIIETIMHIKHAFNKNHNPIESFQNHFQTSFL